jgi:hypothetical protein
VQKLGINPNALVLILHFLDKVLDVWAFGRDKHVHLPALVFGHTRVLQDLD